MGYFICEGLEPGSKKRRKYAAKITEFGQISSFHKLKEKTFTWGAKYGPYNTIKQEAGASTWYKVSKDTVSLVDVEVFQSIDPNYLEINASF